MELDMRERELTESRRVCEIQNGGHCMIAFMGTVVYSMFNITE